MNADTQLESIRQRIYRIPIDLKFTSTVKALVTSEIKTARRSLSRGEYLKFRKLLAQELHALVVGWNAVTLARIPSLLKNPDRLMTQLAAQDLKRFSKLIGIAADEGRKQFFIDLGNVLSGKINPHVWDRRDLTLAAVDFANPSTSASGLIREMEKFNWRYKEQTGLRMQKHRLAKDIDAAGKAIRELSKKHSRRAKP